MLDSYDEQIDNIDDLIEAKDRQIDSVDETIGKLDEEINKNKELKEQQQQYLDFYKTYSDELAQADGKRKKALDDLNEALATYTQLAQLPEIQDLYNAAMKQFADDINGYAKGGVVDYNGLARVHGGRRSELVLNNNDVGKLYAMIHGSSSSQLVDKMVANHMKQSMSGIKNLNNNKTNTGNSYTWQLSGNNIIVDNYEQFKEYMDRYVREAKQDLVVGR